MPVIQKGNDPLGILQQSQNTESQIFDPLGILKKKVDGQDGGQEPKKDGIPPTQSQSQSKSQDGEEKPSWQTSALNPLVGIKKAEEKKAQEPVKFVAKTPPVNVDNIRKYEASQQMYNLADKNKANILSKDEHSMFSPLPLMEDVAGALIPGYAENAKSKRYREITKADQDLEITRKNAMASQDALKQEIPKILSPVSDKWNEFISYTVDRVPKLDEYKIRDFANQTAKQYGVQENGMFYNLIKRETSNLVTQKLIQPAVDEQLKINYKKEFGTNLDDDLKSESNQAALKLEEIKASAKASANKLQNQISLEARDKVTSISTDITNQVNALNDEMKIASEAINNNYSSLIKDGKFIGTQEQYSQYQQDFAALQQKEKENKQAFDALNKSFLDEQNLIFSKANARYRREAEEISKIAQSQYEKFKPKANPQLQKNIEKIYYKSYDEVLNKNQELRRTMSSFNTPMENFTYNLVSSFGGWLKGQGANAGLEGVVTFGDFLQNSYAQDVTEFKSAKDYLDFQKLAKWSGQIIGGMLPGMAGAAAVTAATGGSGAPIGLQMIAAGATQWAAETYSNAGNIKADVLAATGDIAKANNAERQTIAFQKDILPLYSFSGLPFIGKPVSQLISKYIPSAVRATSPTIAKIAGFAERKYVAPIIGGLAETLEELPQEYSQNLSEEAIRKEGSYENMFDYHTKEKLQNTALNIAPMFLFGSVGELVGQSEETKKQYATQQAAKSFALKTEFAKLAPGQKEQFLFDVIQRQGAPFAAAYLTANYSSGQIDKATFEGMQQTYAKQVELLGKTEELGLTPVQAKLYNAFSTYYDNEKQRFDETEDPILKTIAGARMAEYQNAITNIAMQKEPNYSVVTYPDNTQMVFMHSELENALNQPAFAKAVANGDIKVGVFGESEKLNTKIEETKKSVVAAQEEEQKVAKEEEANTRKEIETTFNVEIEDNVGGMGVEVKGLGTEEETQQAKQALRDAGIKLREDATENVTGLPSQVGEGQELVTTEPQQGAGTEATGTGGVLQTQGVGGQVQGTGQKVLTPVSVSNKTELTGLEQRTSSDKNKSAVLESAKKAIATLKSVFPDMDIFIHEDGDAYNKTMEQLKGTQNSRGNFAFERDKNKNPTGKGRIDINLSNASETTVAHEVTHAVLLKAFGDNPATFKQFRDRISPILRADLNKDLLEFENMYAGQEVAPEEYLTQLSALLSKGAETVEYKPSTLRKIAAVINDFVAKITGGKFQPFKGEVDFKNFVDFLNQMSQAIEKGDVIKNLNTQEAYSSGESIPVSNPKDFVAKKIGETKSKAEIGDYQFPDDIEALKIANLPVKNLTDLVRQYEGRVVIITSDATGYGVDGMGQPIFGGFGFSANAKNVNDGIGFASVSIGTVKGTYTAAEKAYGLGKSLVLVMVQPPHTTINNSYGAKYMIRGIKEIAGQSKEELAKTKEAIKDFIKNSTAIQNELKGNEASLKRGSEKRLFELIDGIDENTDLDAAVEEFLADTTFTIRKELGKGIILENKDIRTNKSTNYAKIALNNAGYNIYSFLKEYGDNTILNDDLILNNTGGYVVGGFELDILPTEEREKLISDIQSKGIVHPLFNAKLPGTNHFRLDGLYDVQENFSEYVRPETTITLEQKERDKLVRKYYKEDKYYNAQYRSIPLNKRTYTQLTIPAKTEFKEKYLRKKGALVETIPNIATKVAKGEGFITKPGAAEQMAKATYKSKAQLPEQVKATAKALEDVEKEARETIRYNYEDSFGFNDFDWNEESKRENFREWLKDFEKKQFNKNLPKVIKEVKEDIELLKEKELSHAKLKDFEDLIIPSLGNEALVPILSKFEEDVLLDPYLTLEQMEKGFKEAKNIIDEDGSLNMRKIETGEILNKEKRISLPGFERFVENNPDYKGVFDAWKKIFDKDIELTLKETNAYRYPSIKELENLYKDLTKSEAPTTITSKSQLPKQEQEGVGEVKTKKLEDVNIEPIDFENESENIDVYEASNTAEKIAKDNGVNILRGKDLINVALDKNGDVIGGLWTEIDSNEFSFDIAIDKTAQGKGVGEKLVKAAISEFNAQDYEGQLKYKIDVTNPIMEKLLSKYGFEVVDKIPGHTIMEHPTNNPKLKAELPKQEGVGVGEEKTEGGSIKSKSEKTKVDFGEGEEGKDNKKEFDKLTSTIPNSGEVTKYLSGETIEKYEGEKPRNEQEVIAQQLRPALERGVDIIEKAKELFGEEYVEKLLQYVETENLPPANKALIYVSLENEVAKQKLENPSEAAKISKMQDLVRAKSQAFLRSNSLAINMGRLRKFAEVGYDVNRLTDRFFSSRELEDKKKIEDALQATADDINKEAAQQLQDEIDNIEKVENNDEEGIAKIFEQLPEKRKTVIKKAISAIDRMMGRFSVKMSSRYKSKNDLNSILENGTKKIKNALRAGIKIEDAVEIGIESMKKEHEKEYSQKWADEDTFRNNITQELNAAGLLTPIPKLFTKNALIEKGYGKEINVKTKNGIEKRTILDWKKLAGEEGSVDKIKEKVESVLKDRGYTDAEISQMQQDFIDEYNNLRQSIVEKSLNEINARNKQATTPEQKSAVRKLVEMYNYGLFDKDPNAYELALAKTVGLKGLSLENFIKVKELGDVMSNLFNSNFEGKPLNESQLRSAIQVIEEKMRVILNSEAMQQGGTAFKLSEIVKEYMDASQRMMLNTVKQGIENPISGLLERFYSSIGYAGTIPEQLNAQQRKMARDIYKEMVLQKGMGYGNVGNAFISKGSLDAHIHNMSDSELVQGIMSVAMGKTILDAVDSAYKAKITQQKFTYNLIKILTKDRMVNGKLEKGMSKEEAKRYVAEKISGQSFEDAKQTAKNIIDKINTDAGKKIFNDSPEFINRLATDIVNAALVNGEKITEEMVTAAYNAAYRAAGRGLGHVANNPISEQINTVSGKLESRISDAVKQKKFAKATYLNLYSIFYRNIANPFVGGGTNWIVLKAEKTGLGLISGLISMYKDRGSKMDLMTDTGMKELEDVMFNSMKTKDKFMRGAVGGAVTALAFMLIKATVADDEYEKWIKKNQWAKKYLTILTPEIMLAMLAARQKGAYTKYLESSFNKNEAFDKGKMAIKAATYLAAGEKEKAAGQAGQLVGSSIGNPIPWRLVRDGQQIWVGATGGEPYAINPASPNTFAEGYLKGGFVDYLGYAPTSEDKSTIVSTKEFDSPAYKVFKEKEIKMPKVGERTSYEIPASVRENKQMTEEEFDKFSKSVKEYELNGWVEVDKVTKRKTKHYSLKEILDEKWKIKVRGKMPKTVLGKDLPKEDLQNKVNQLHSSAVEKAKEDLGFIKDEKEKRKVTQSKY